MLVLTRKRGEGIVIGHDVRLTVVSIRGNRVRLAVAAPDGAVVRRPERGGGQDSQTDSSKK